MQPFLIFLFSIKRRDNNTDEEDMSEMSSIEPDYSSFSDTDTDTDTDVEDEEPADRTMCEEWTHSVPPPLPPRNGVQVSDSSQINDSGSNDSFPKGAPRPI